jgi:hypothetical protein
MYESRCATGVCKSLEDTWPPRTYQPLLYFYCLRPYYYCKVVAAILGKSLLIPPCAGSDSRELCTGSKQLSARFAKSPGSSPAFFLVSTPVVRFVGLSLPIDVFIKTLCQADPGFALPLHIAPFSIFFYFYSWAFFSPAF